MSLTSCTPDPFLMVLGVRRGVGDTRLDRLQPSQAALARMSTALDRARAGNLEPACQLLLEHRRSLENPLVAGLLTGTVAAACDLEFSARQDWLADFLHATVRDGRDGRVMRHQTEMRTQTTPGRHDLHLRPGAEVDTPTFSAHRDIEPVVSACGFAGHLQRAPVGVWQNPTAETNYIYSHCSACEQYAGQVPEAISEHAGLLPAADLAYLAVAHRATVTKKLAGVLRRRGPAGVPLGRYAAESFPTAAVAAGVYALSGGDERLSTFCEHYSSIELHAREKGYTQPMLDLLDAEFFTAALRARMPRRPARMSAYAAASWHTPAKSGRATWHSRRERFNQAVAERLDCQVRCLRRARRTAGKRG